MRRAVKPPNVRFIHHKVTDRASKNKLIIRSSKSSDSSSSSKGAEEGKGGTGQEEEEDESSPSNPNHNANVVVLPQVLPESKFWSTFCPGAVCKRSSDNQNSTRMTWKTFDATSKVNRKNSISFLYYKLEQRMGNTETSKMRKFIGQGISMIAPDSLKSQDEGKVELKHQQEKPLKKNKSHRNGMMTTVPVTQGENKKLISTPLYVKPRTLSPAIQNTGNNITSNKTHTLNYQSKKSLKGTKIKDSHHQLKSKFSSANLQSPQNKSTKNNDNNSNKQGHQNQCTNQNENNKKFSSSTSQPSLSKSLLLSIVKPPKDVHSKSREKLLQHLYNRRSDSFPFLNSHKYYKESDKDNNNHIYTQPNTTSLLKSSLKPQKIELSHRDGVTCCMALNFNPSGEIVPKPPKKSIAIQYHPPPPGPVFNPTVPPTPPIIPLREKRPHDDKATVFLGKDHKSYRYERKRKLWRKRSERDRNSNRDSEISEENIIRHTVRTKPSNMSNYPSNKMNKEPQRNNTTSRCRSNMSRISGKSSIIDHHAPKAFMNFNQQFSDIVVSKQSTKSVAAQAALEKNRDKAKVKAAGNQTSSADELSKPLDNGDTKSRKINTNIFLKHEATQNSSSAIYKQHGSKKLYPENDIDNDDDNKENMETEDTIKLQQEGNAAANTNTNDVDTNNKENRSRSSKSNKNVHKLKNTFHVHKPKTGKSRPEINGRFKSKTAVVPEPVIPIQGSYTTGMPTALNPQLPPRSKVNSYLATLKKEVPTASAWESSIINNTDYSGNRSSVVNKGKGSTKTLKSQINASSLSRDPTGTTMHKTKTRQSFLNTVTTHHKSHSHGLPLLVNANQTKQLVNINLTGDKKLPSSIDDDQINNPSNNTNNTNGNGKLNAKNLDSHPSFVPSKLTVSSHKSRAKALQEAMKERDLFLQAKIQTQEKDIVRIHNNKKKKFTDDKVPKGQPSHFSHIMSYKNSLINSSKTSSIQKSLAPLSIKSEFERMKKQKMPVIWIFGYTQITIAKNVQLVINTIEQKHRFYIIDLDTEISKWKNSPIFRDPREQLADPENFQDAITYRAKKVLKGQREGDKYLLSSSDVCELLKLAMLSAATAKGSSGFIIKNFPVNTDEGQEFEIVVYPFSAGLYFLNNKWSKDRTIPPETFKPKTFKRDYAYSEYEVEKAVDAFGNKTIKLSNCEDLQGSRTEDIAILVKHHLVGLGNALRRNQNELAQKNR